MPAQTPAPTENAPTPPAQNAPPAPSANAPATVLPQTNVQAPKQAAKPAKPRVVTREAGPATPAPLSPEQQAAAAVAAKNAVFDQARSNIYTSVGTASDTISHQTVEDLPQGTNEPLEKVLVQTLPGVSQDSAASSCDSLAMKFSPAMAAISRNRFSAAIFRSSRGIVLIRGSRSSRRRRPQTSTFCLARSSRQNLRRTLSDRPSRRPLDISRQPRGPLAKRVRTSAERASTCAMPRHPARDERPQTRERAMPWRLGDMLIRDRRCIRPKSMPTLCRSPRPPGGIRGTAT